MSLIPLNNIMIEDNSIHHIIDHIHLGNSDSRHFITNHNIKKIIEIGSPEELKNYKQINNINKLTIQFEDNRKIDISPYFPTVWDFINKGNDNTLIHCKMGTSRSVSFLISYLIKFKNISFEYSIKLIDSKRNNKIYKIYTKPNIGFTKILKSLQN
jgi:protein-tyrosine phosphatase